jgi:hypothetical protein
MQLTIKYDRIGAVYYAGEMVTGVVQVETTGAINHSGVVLDVTGTLQVQPSVRGLGSFEPFHPQLTPISMIKLSFTLAKKGEKLPAGGVDLPFSFVLEPTAGADGSLVETYNGVFVSSSYQAVATVIFSFSKVVSDPASILVICPGQSVYLRDNSAPKDLELYNFSLNESMIKNSRKNSAPKFTINGAISLVNDVDVPLRGWLSLDACETPVSSVELQLIRVESAAATLGTESKEATEIQNIQIGEGDVPRNTKIPIYMFFPRWFTCPSVRSSHIRVDFECNLVFTFADKMQLTHNFPLILFRANKHASSGEVEVAAAKE